MGVVAAQLLFPDIGLAFVRVAADGLCVTTSILDNIKSVQLPLSISNEEE